MSTNPKKGRFWNECNSEMPFVIVYKFSQLVTILMITNNFSPTKKIEMSAIPKTKNEAIIF
ncbi:hypothetical protein B0A69_02895 [Chryseobacterium shigense]|uniref:Uncharacterized protein n=1 Tax=Chryseobacterium shigense TaxID=297244 RepID=A0A1N7I827_9FLAO|nr:hypothetical protein B0A69_02895 [Chryseobacterium shigense]SIS33217.1 hypothetical protein SAMN05421639_102552 [Chryseobacterium shigense]